MTYDAYDEHQLTHHFCAHCSKNLTTYEEIRSHYYEKCTKYKVNCEECEFIFPRRDYLEHDCLQHYDLRRLELLLICLTLYGQAATMGILKGVFLSECGLAGELRNFLKTLVPNIIFGFWALSMWMNYKTI